MSPDHDAASRFWDREAVSPSYTTWMSHPLVREYINSSISGSPHAWPVDWLVSKLGARTFRRGLSIGCGTGPLERDLLRRNLVVHVDAFDGSPESVNVARQLAEAEGLGDRVTYWIGDFNEPVIPDRQYDLILFHQSAHHVAKLEKLFGALLGVLATDGLLYLDEYVGPSRFAWDDALAAPHRAVYDALPATIRLYEVMPLPIQADDPSEAIRSDEIVPQLTRGFRIVDRRDYGGNLLSVLFPLIRWEAAADRVLPELLDEERRWLAAGDLSYYSVVIAEAKPFRAWKRLLYFIAPKLRRVRHLLLTRVLRHSNARF